MSNKSIATHQSYDPYDCTSTGYDFTLYSDGSVAVEGHSCWQGSTSGDRYRSDAGTVDLSKLDESDPDNDAEALLEGIAAPAKATASNNPTQKKQNNTMKPKRTRTPENLSYRTLGNLPPTRQENARNDDRFTLLCMAIGAIAAAIVWLVEH
jgi:hypothetical protein